MPETNELIKKFNEREDALNVVIFGEKVCSLIRVGSKIKKELEASANGIYLLSEHTPLSFLEYSLYRLYAELEPDFPFDKNDYYVPTDKAEEDMILSAWLCRRIEFWGEVKHGNNKTVIFTFFASDENKYKMHYVGIFDLEHSGDEEKDFKRMIELVVDDTKAPTKQYSKNSAYFTFAKSLATTRKNEELPITQSFSNKPFWM